MSNVLEFFLMSNVLELFLTSTVLKLVVMSNVLELLIHIENKIAKLIENEIHPTGRTFSENQNETPYVFREDLLPKFLKININIFTEINLILLLLLYY